VTQNQNYTIAGVEYGVQCFCDMAIRNGGIIGKEGDCDFLCSGNEDEICGAGDRLSVYSIGIPQVLSSLVI
jgi:hypothetical protein